VPDLHDTGGALVGQRPKEHRVHNGEDRGVGPYAEPQDNDSGQGEPWVAQQDAQAESESLQPGYAWRVPPLTASKDISGDTNYRRRNSPGCFLQVFWSAVPDTALLDCAEFCPVASGVYS